MQERRPEPALSAPLGARRLRILIPTAVVVVVVDQLTKWWALQALEGRTVDLVWTLRLRLVFNQGAAFGLGSRYAPLIALAALAVVGYLLRGDGLIGSRLSSAATGLVVGGAVGNLLDRLFRADDGIFSGAVVDFVDLQWWPVFNVADVAITCGAVVLAVTVGLAPAPEDADRAPDDAGAPGDADGAGAAGADESSGDVERDVANPRGHGGSGTVGGTDG